MIRLVISDVDGVLTDGRINIGEAGELFKSFDVSDGLGIAQWIESGGSFAIITSRESDAVRHRARELGVDRVHQGVADKVSVVKEIARDEGVPLDEVAYMGDDDSDMPTIERVGFGATPRDGSRAARQVADYVCTAAGGDGAVRELIDRIHVEDRTVLGVIPARYGSTRFPGKPLADIAGKPMIQHVYERASKATQLDDVVVATDDERIADVVDRIGGNAAMTDPDLPTGSDRVAAVAQDADYDVTVNIQGDEPLIEPDVIDSTVEGLLNSSPRMATPISTITNAESLKDENTVKVVIDSDNLALYFSRSQIPSRGGVGNTYKHIGLYAFETDLLLDYVHMDSDIEGHEDLEQLRLLENGYDIQTVFVDYEQQEVNNREDVEEVENLLDEYDD